MVIDNPRNPEERLARVKLVEYLQHHAYQVDVAKRDSDKPPDYYFCIDGTWFAVEVTQVAESSRNTRGKPTSAIMAPQRIRKWVAKMAAKVQLPNDESWTVQFSGNLAVFDAQRIAIEERLESFLMDLNRDKNRCTLAYSREPYFRVVVYRSANGARSLCASLSDSGFAAEVQDRLVAIVQDAMNRKLLKLHDVQLPHILMLIGRFPLATQAEYTEVRDRLDYHDFVAVYVLVEDEVVVLKESALPPALEPPSERAT